MSKHIEPLSLPTTHPDETVYAVAVKLNEVIEVLNRIHGMTVGGVVSAIEEQTDEASGNRVLKWTTMLPNSAENSSSET